MHVVQALPSSEKDEDITQYFKNRYGEGKATEEICPKCSRKFECLSARTYANDSGIVQYHADDCRLCDACCKDEEWYKY